MRRIAILILVMMSAMLTASEQEDFFLAAGTPLFRTGNFTGRPDRLSPEDMLVKVLTEPAVPDVTARQSPYSKSSSPMTAVLVQLMMLKLRLTVLLLCS